MKSNWDVLKEKVINDDKEEVVKWIRGLRRYPHTPVLDYLEWDSNEPWLYEVIAELEEKNKDVLEKFAAEPERYLVSVEDLKKALFGEWKGV